MQNEQAVGHARSNSFTDSPEAAIARSWVASEYGGATGRKQTHARVPASGECFFIQLILRTSLGRLAERGGFEPPIELLTL